MATTINSYSVGLSLNASDYIKKSSLSATETRRLRRAIEEAREPTEKLSLEQDRLTKAYEEGAIDLEVYTRLMEKAASKYKDVGNSIQSADPSMRGMLDNVKGFIATNPGMIAAGVAIAGVGVAAKVAFDTVSQAVTSLREIQIEIDGVAKQATKLGITYDQFTAIAGAAKELGGVEVDAVEDALKELQMRLAEAAQGPNSYREAFEKLGIDAEAALRKGPVAALAEVSAAFEKLGTQGEKLFFAEEIMADAGSQLVGVLEQGAEKLQESIEFQQKWKSLTEEQVAGVEANNAAWQRVDTIITGLQQKLAAEFAPAFQLVADEILALSGSLNGLDQIIRVIVDSTVAMAGGFKDTVEAAYLFATVIDRIKSGNIQGLREEIDNALDFSTADKWLEKLYEKREKLAQESMEREKKRKEQMEEAASGATQAVTETNEATKDAAGKSADNLFKAAKDWAKGIADFVKEADKAFTKDVEQALNAAKKHFESERQKAQKLQEEIAKGPGSGMEVGSGEAAAFMASQENARIAAATVQIPDAQPTQEQLVEETRRQFELMQQMKTQDAEQLRVMKEMLQEAKNNGFQRIR